MLNVYNHEGEFSYDIDGQEIQFRGATIFVNATASVVYGRQDGDVMWEFDRVNLIYATDEDAEDINLTADEQKELEALIAYELSNDADIEDKVHADHEETLYWESRR